LVGTARMASGAATAVTARKARGPACDRTSDDTRSARWQRHLRRLRSRTQYLCSICANLCPSVAQIPILSILFILSKTFAPMASFA
jgi:hypothetical protein